MAERQLPFPETGDPEPCAGRRERSRDEIRVRCTGGARVDAAARFYAGLQLQPINVTAVDQDGGRPVSANALRRRRRSCHGPADPLDARGCRFSLQGSVFFSASEHKPDSS